MDTSQEFEQVKKKHALKAPVTIREMAVVFQNDEESLMKYLAENDFIQVYGLLHKGESPLVIGKNAKFTPDKKRVEGELKSLLVKRDFRTLNSILENFRINLGAPNFTSNPKLIEALSDIKAIVMTPSGYKFNLILQ